MTSDNGPVTALRAPFTTLALRRAVVRMARRAARSLAILVCVDGLASYVTASPGSSGSRSAPAGPADRGCCPRAGCCWAR